MAIGDPTDIPDCIRWIDPENSEGIVYKTATHPDLVSSIPSWHTGVATSGFGSYSGAGGMLRRSSDTILGRQGLYCGADVAALEASYGLTTAAGTSYPAATIALVYKQLGATAAWYAALVDNWVGPGTAEIGCALYSAGSACPTASAGYPDTVGPAATDFVIGETYAVFIWTDGTGTFLKTVNLADDTEGESFVAKAGTKLSSFMIGHARFNTTRYVNGIYGQIAAYSRVLTLSEQADFVEFAKNGPAVAPYPGLHEVTNIDNVGNPQCIYFGQTPAIVIGDEFSFKETTEINGWGVDIDDDGFPVITADNIAGIDSFLFDVDRGEGYNDPSEWSFAIQLILTDIIVSDITAEGCTVTVTTNSNQGKLYLSIRTAAQGGAYTEGDQELIRDGIIDTDCVYKDEIATPDYTVPQVFTVTGLDPGVEFYVGLAQDVDAI